MSRGRPRYDDDVPRWMITWSWDHERCVDGLPVVTRPPLTATARAALFAEYEPLALHDAIGRRRAVLHAIDPTTDPESETPTRRPDVLRREEPEWDELTLANPDPEETEAVEAISPPQYLSLVGWAVGTLKMRMEKSR